MVGRNGTLGIEIKTTICKTEKQCKQAIIKFDYDQAIAWYMDLAKIEEAVIMFVSKHNFNVFNFYINKQSQYYIIGKAKYQQIAFDYWAIKSYE